MQNGEATPKLSGFSKGLIVGSVAGAIIGLFYAPRSGAELRKDVRKQMITMRMNLDRYARLMRRQSKILMKKVPSIT